MDDLIDKSGDVRKLKNINLQAAVDTQIAIVEAMDHRGARLDIETQNGEHIEVILGVSPANNLSIVAAYKRELKDVNSNSQTDWAARASILYSWK